MKLAEKHDRLTSFALSHSQKKLINNALKKQNQQMKAEHVDIIRLTHVRAMIMKKAENTNNNNNNNNNNKFLHSCDINQIDS